MVGVSVKWGNILSNKLKAKAMLDAIRGGAVKEIGKAFCVHPIQVALW